MLEWNVYTGNFNTRQIEKENIFEHSYFLNDCQKAARRFAKDKEGFEKAVRSSLMYYFWSKCEWEIVLSQFHARKGDPELKIDVYDQVNLNWQQFIDYLWSHAVELRRREKKGENK